MESIAQGVAQRVIELVLDSLDLNQIIDRVDINQVIDRVDINQVIDRVDINQVIDRVDINQVIDRVDINQIVSRIDIETLVKNSDLGALIVSSSSSIVTEAVDLGRSHAVSLDDTLARWVSRIRRNNHSGRAEPPQLPNTPEEP
jgi:predicted nucleic acid-binding protein